MAGLNEVKIIGNLGRDPDIRAMTNGEKVANLSIATSETWKDKSTGEKKEKTEWHRVVIFGKLADVVEKYCRKGSKVYVCGKLQTKKWADADGNDKYSTEVVLSGFKCDFLMLDAKKTEDSGMQNTESNPAPVPQDIDDDIPF